MSGGRWWLLTGFIRRGKEVQDGMGAALRDAFPMETEADEAMQRCIEQLDLVEGTLKGRLGNGTKR